MNCTWIIPTQCISLCRQESSSRRNPFLSAVHLVHCTVAILRPTPSPLSLPLFERQEAAVDGFTVTLLWLPYPPPATRGTEADQTRDVFSLNSVSQIKLIPTPLLLKSLQKARLFLLCRLQIAGYRFKSYNTSQDLVEMCSC